MKRPLRTTLTAAAVTVASIALAAPAWAHVEVSGTDATQGGYGVLTFRVPSESDTASTTNLVVTLPDDQPIISVDTQPKPGWTATVTKKKLTTPQKDDDGNEITDYISTVEWKADNPQAGIPPNQFDMFNISAGPLPKEAMISLPAVQTYSDGKVVHWDEKAAMGQPEPEHPAPMLMLSAGGDQAVTAPAATPAPTTSAAPSASAASATSSGPAWPGITALVVAVVAVLLGIVNLVLVRRRSS
ncbi:YcnI family copper-binding membrane protein [Mycolicibacterium sphagni]|uniref:YcnI family copper-binding membrane protein n=1 Tax=Mycolicibacterium sphagni TaxID=1786 RepID=UPI0021F29CE5|nr:YcnI family protein [Mycolicibacterium sphagni]MCV7174621.1 YcnI family protein [Mycolicibacterium sphagni]